MGEMVMDERSYTRVPMPGSVSHHLIQYNPDMAVSLIYKDMENKHTG